MPSKKDATSARKKSGIDKRANQIEQNAATSEAALSRRAASLEGARTNHTDRLVVLEAFMNRAGGFSGLAHHHDDIYYRQASLYTQAATNNQIAVIGDNRFAPNLHANANHSVNFAPSADVYTIGQIQSLYYTTAQIQNLYYTKNQTDAFYVRK